MNTRSTSKISGISANFIGFVTFQDYFLHVYHDYSCKHILTHFLTVKWILAWSLFLDWHVASDIHMEAEPRAQDPGAQQRKPH